MRLVDVSVHAIGYRPSRGTYRRRYRYAIAVCETDPGAIRHGPFEGWTEDLDQDGNAAWIEWRRLIDTEHLGCLCLDEDRESCLGRRFGQLEKLDGTKGKDGDTTRTKVRLRLPHGHRVGDCACGGRVRYDPDEDALVCTNDCPEGPDLVRRDGQTAPSITTPRGGAVA